jgi:hypothetical protein
MTQREQRNVSGVRNADQVKSGTSTAVRHSHVSGNMQLHVSRNFSLLTVHGDDDACLSCVHVVYKGLCFYCSNPKTGTLTR